MFLTFICLFYCFHETNSAAIVIEQQSRIKGDRKLSKIKSNDELFDSIVRD